MQYINKCARYAVYHVIRAKGKEKAGRGLVNVEVEGCRMCSMKLLAILSLVVCLRGLRVGGQWCRAWTLEPDCLGPGSSIYKLCSLEHFA